MIDNREEGWTFIINSRPTASLNNRSFASQSTSASFVADQPPLLKLLHLNAGRLHTDLLSGDIQDVQLHFTSSCSLF
jgi:hypothetical protein